MMLIRPNPQCESRPRASAVESLLSSGPRCSIARGHRPPRANPASVLSRKRRLRRRCRTRYSLISGADKKAAPARTAFCRRNGSAGSERCPHRQQEPTNNKKINVAAAEASARRKIAFAAQAPVDRLIPARVNVVPTSAAMQPLKMQTARLHVRTGRKCTRADSSGCARQPRKHAGFRSSLRVSSAPCVRS